MVRLKRRRATSNGSLSRRRTLGMKHYPSCCLGRDHGWGPGPKLGNCDRQLRQSASVTGRRSPRNTHDPAGSRPTGAVATVYRECRPHRAAPDPPMLVLGIETSCDETGLAVYDERRGLLAHALHSQVAMHTIYGGVVPE